MKEAVFALPEFKKDGIYSFDLTAVDKAGNKSVLCRNTSVLMMNSDVLAYITESKKRITLRILQVGTRCRKMRRHQLANDLMILRI